MVLGYYAARFIVSYRAPDVNAVFVKLWHIAANFWKVEVVPRISGLAAYAHFKMQVDAAGTPGGTHDGDALPLLDLLAASDQNF
jgi:hypothetical protein